MGLLGLKSGDPLPSGGYSFVVTVKSGDASAQSWTDIFGPLFAARCGITLQPGSLNLWADHNISWDRPREIISVESSTGEFCPVVIEETAVGVAVRMNHQTPRFLETLSPVGLRNQLHLRDGQRIAVRLLPGSSLASCLTSA